MKLEQKSQVAQTIGQDNLPPLWQRSDKALDTLLSELLRQSVISHVSSQGVWENIKQRVQSAPRV